MKHKLKAEQRIELVHVSLMRSPEFALFAGLFMVGKTSVVDIPITARTNGRDAQYGRGFVDSLSDKELAFLVMHENMHKAYVQACVHMEFVMQLYHKQVLGGRYFLHEHPRHASS